MSVKPKEAINKLNLSERECLHFNHILVVLFKIQYTVIQKSLSNKLWT